jgi:hypothetical protein
MSQASNWQFGLIMAYVLPGFIALVGTAPLLPVACLLHRPERHWKDNAPPQSHFAGY